MVDGVWAMAAMVDGPRVAADYQEHNFDKIMYDLCEHISYTRLQQSKELKHWSSFCT